MTYSSRREQAGATSWRSRLAHACADERGDIGVGSVIVWMGTLLITFAIIQGGMYFHGKSTASYAADAAANAASWELGSNGAGQAAADNILSQSGGLNGASVSVTSDAQSVTATVTGTVLVLVPGWHLTVSQTTTSAIEQYIPRGQP